MIRKFFIIVAGLVGLAMTRPALALPQCPNVMTPKIISAPSYVVTQTDNCWWIVLTNPGLVTVTLPAPGLVFSPGFQVTILPVKPGTEITFNQLADDAGNIHQINTAPTLTTTAGQGGLLKIQQDLNWWFLSTGTVNSTLVPNNAALEALSTGDYSTLTRQGFYAAGDAPYMVYMSASALNFNPPNNTCTLNSGNGDNGSQVKSVDGKCWIAIYASSTVDAREWGSTTSGDTTPQLQACLAAMGVIGGTCYAGAGRYTISSADLSIPAGTTLSCSAPGSGWPVLPTATMQTAPALLVATAHKVVAGGLGAAYYGCREFNSAITLPITTQAGFGGIGFSDNHNDDVTVKNVVMAGFDSLLYLTGNRGTVRGVDGFALGVTHAAIEWDGGLLNSGDMSDVQLASGDFGATPLCTVGLSAGTGIRIGAVGGSVTATAVFMHGRMVVIGYNTYDYDFENNAQFDEIWADNEQQTCGFPAGTGQIGVKFAAGLDGIIGNQLVSDQSYMGVQFGATDLIQLGSVSTEGANAINGTAGGGLNFAGVPTHVAIGRLIDYQNGTSGSYVVNGSGAGIAIGNDDASQFQVGDIATDATAGSNIFAASAGSTWALGAGADAIGRIASTNITSVSCTGMGTGGSCTLGRLSTLTEGAISLNFGTGASTSGALTITYPFNGSPVCTGNIGSNLSNANLFTITPGLNTCNYVWSTGGFNPSGITSAVTNSTRW